MKKKQVIDWINERIWSLTTGLSQDAYNKHDKEIVVESLEYLEFIKKEMEK